MAARPPRSSGSGDPTVVRGAPVPKTGGSDEQTRPSAQRAAATAKPAPPIGAIPDEPRAGGTSTKTQRVVAKLQREWQNTALYLGLAIFLGVSAIWMWSKDHEVIAVVLGLAIVPVTFAALFVRRAPCPRCFRPVTIIGIEQCEHCREYIYIEGNQLKLVGEGFIGDWHSFELNVPLPIVPRMTFPSDRCCVCGERADQEDTLEVQKTRIVVAHCWTHSDNKGVIWQIGLVSEAVPSVTFKFRSFDYWRAVRQANWVHVRSGMWRS